ncbi:MAG: nucleotidyl transferase AbiEii/AbiGii toxin family protein [Candidatus Margulisbacteria bacterium]|nr:nucleotidyl transferase AbiEii/AbiGii toxin family protein [Candidatus Margulisiibacteriota bacterium]
MKPMLDMINKFISAGQTREEKIHLLREYLQLLILKIIYDAGYFKYLSFTGGTALRVLYDLKRFSEDLDFSLIEKKGYDFTNLHENIGGQLNKNYGLNAVITAHSIRTVQGVDIKFAGLLFKLGLSEHRTQVLYIKLEIDTNPPKGGDITLSLVNTSFVFTVTHFDLPSMFATKLHACFYRKYTKGRDLYDLVWYLSRKILPNFTLLNNAIEQTQKTSSHISAANLAAFLSEGIDKIDFKQVKKEVERFIINKSELDLLNAAKLKKSIASQFAGGVNEQ